MDAESFLDTADWVEPYEQMRNQALKGKHCLGGWGGAILVRNGMVAWMRARAALPARTPANRPANPAVSSPASNAEVSTECYGQIAAILASMFFEARQEVLV